MIRCLVCLCNKFSPSNFVAPYTDDGAVGISGASGVLAFPPNT